MKELGYVIISKLPATFLLMLTSKSRVARLPVASSVTPPLDSLSLRYFRMVNSDRELVIGHSMSYPVGWGRAGFSVPISDERFLLIPVSQPFSVGSRWC